MFDAVFHLGAFGVVEPVERPDQITGDPADPFKGFRLQLPGQIDKLPVQLDVDGGELASGVFVFYIGNVGVDLLLGDAAAGDGYSCIHIGTPFPNIVS